MIGALGPAGRVLAVGIGGGLSRERDAQLVGEAASRQDAHAILLTHGIPTQLDWEASHAPADER